MRPVDTRERLAEARLYLVLEARPHGADPSALLDAALRGGVDLVQLRDKELSTDALVGLSIEAPEQLARVDGADYLGVGAVFGTPTKTDALVPGLELVRLAAARATLPWFAIGGIDASTLP